MNTRKAKGRTGKARKPAPKTGTTVRQRLDTFGKALGEGANELVRWLRKAMEAVVTGVATFGRSAADTATAIEAELRDDVAGVKKRLAAKKETAPARKPATRKAAKKPAAAKKASGRRKAPVRRKATAKKATARRTAPRKKKAAPRRKAASAGK